jgi:hypothetical protein
MVTSSYELEGETLVYRQGLRRIAIPLGEVRGLAVRERGAFLGFTGSQLLFKLASGKTRATLFDPASEACRALLAILRARLPAMEPPTRPWYEGFLHPRSVAGIVILGASSIASGGMPRDADRAERLGYGVGLLMFTIAGIALIISGFRRSRARAKTPR